MNTQPIPIAIVYALPNKDGGMDVAAQLTKHTDNQTFTSLFVSCACVSLYESFLAHVKESDQIEFEELFQKTFARVFEIKENYTDVFQLDDPDAGIE